MRIDTANNSTVLPNHNFGFSIAFRTQGRQISATCEVMNSFAVGIGELLYMLLEGS